MPKIEIKRVYETTDTSHGARFLADGLWPRGLKKEALRGTVWLKEVAPSDALRRRYGHDPKKWQEFRRRYFAELVVSGNHGSLSWRHSVAIHRAALQRAGYGAQQCRSGSRLFAWEVKKMIRCIYRCSRWVPDLTLIRHYFETGEGDEPYSRGQ